MPGLQWDCGAPWGRGHLCCKTEDFPRRGGRRCFFQADKRDLCLESLILRSSVAQSAWSERSSLPHANVTGSTGRAAHPAWMAALANRSKTFPFVLGSHFQKTQHIFMASQCLQLLFYSILNNCLILKKYMVSGHSFIVLPSILVQCEELKFFMTAFSVTLKFAHESDLHLGMMEWIFAGSQSKSGSSPSDASSSRCQ